MSERPLPVQHRGFGLAWLLVCIVFALHVWDEAAHDFLGYYNATVLTLYGHFSWFPRMGMTFREWLTGLLVAIVLCLARIQFVNGIGHISTTILGGTVPSVRFEGVAPGFYTSPLLLLSSVYLFWRVRTINAS